MTDNLAQYGVRKNQAQRSLDNLVDAADGIICKAGTPLHSRLVQAAIVQRLPEESIYFDRSSALAGVWQSQDLLCFTKQYGDSIP